MPRTFTCPTSRTVTDDRSIIIIHKQVPILGICVSTNGNKRKNKVPNLRERTVFSNGQNQHINLTRESFARSTLGRPLTIPTPDTLLLLRLDIPRHYSSATVRPYCSMVRVLGQIAAAALALGFDLVKGHVYLLGPFSRQVYNSPVFKDW